MRRLYDGQDMIPLVREAYLRLLELAAAMGSLPASYFQYYYGGD